MRDVTGVAKRWHNLHGFRESSVNFSWGTLSASQGHRRDALFQLFDGQLDGVRLFPGSLTHLFLLLRGKGDPEGVAA